MSVTAAGTRRWIMALFRGRVRRWREDKPGGLAVIDIPLDLVTELGGRRQMRMAGSLNGVPFTGSTMLVAGGGFCVGVSRAALHASGAAVGDDVDVQLERASSEPA
jgi:uncharacterized protein DUF1905